MDTSEMIDLGRESDVMGIAVAETGMGKGKGKEKRKSYPSLYIRGTEGIPDLPKGDFYILAKACVSRLSIDTKEEDYSSVELDIKEMKVVGEAEDDSYESEGEDMSSAAMLAKKMGMEEDDGEYEQED